MNGTGYVVEGDRVYYQPPLEEVSWDYISSSREIKEGEEDDLPLLGHIQRQQLGYQRVKSATANWQDEIKRTRQY